MIGKEWHGALRGALYRADGPAVVALLRRKLTPEDSLQLIGDGLIAALTQHVDEGPSLAADCTAALRERAWLGDDHLADQLEAVLGTAAIPMLKALPVDLEELANVREGDPTQGGGRIDLHTGEVWHQAAIEYAQEIEEEDDDESDDAAHWLWVHCQGSHAGYGDMELFIDTVSDADQAERLVNAIHGRGPFRRFKDTLARWPDELDRWHSFSEDRQRGRARAWLAGAGFRPRAPANPLSQSQRD